MKYELWEQCRDFYIFMRSMKCGSHVLVGAN